MSRQAVDQARMELVAQLEMHLRFCRDQCAQMAYHAPAVQAEWQTVETLLLRLDRGCWEGTQFRLGDINEPDKAKPFSEALEEASRGLQELASQVYSLPGERPGNILDRLQRIATDATNVSLHIVQTGNRIGPSRYLLRALQAEFFDAFDSVSHRLVPALPSLKELHRVIGELAKCFELASVSRDRAAEHFDKAYDIHNNELNRAKEAVVLELSKLADAENEEGAPAGSTVVLGPVTTLQTGEGAVAAASQTNNAPAVRRHRSDDEA